MRILHLLPFAGIGGTENGQLRIMEAARRSGIESTVIHFESPPVVGDLMRSHGFEAMYWPAPQPSFKRGAAFLTASWRLAGGRKRAAAYLPN
ncbi:MAG: hypothetical protein FJW20_21755 [Acidimicrobiia bacterium]|nr:hypothetical protein [Acidimicrobiia bacterium]